MDLALRLRGIANVWSQEAFFGLAGRDGGAPITDGEYFGVLLDDITQKLRTRSVGISKVMSSRPLQRKARVPSQ